jgi:radical SAM superfamily enzyme YgiQ (UPF0313 family)
MTRILFIDAINYWDKERDFETAADHLGLLYLSSSLRQRFGAHFDINIIDRDIEWNLDTFKPEVVGISSVTQNFNIAKKYAKLAKSRGCSVIVGGAHISAMPHTLSDDMDVGVVGEGEETIGELMTLYEKERLFINKNSLCQIKGIVYKDGTNIVQTESRLLINLLDKIPFPARDLTYSHGKGVGILTSRGCPYKCRFCFSAHRRNQVRFFSPEYVVKEIKELVDKYHATWIGIYDDLFIANKKRLVRIVDLLKKEGINKHAAFNCNVRANLVDDSTALLLKEMGVRDAFLGLESGVPRILHYLKGGDVTVEHNKMAVDLLKKYDIRCGAGIIIGSPDETREEILATLRFVKKSKLDSFFTFLLTPFPGTPVWEYALKRGLVSDSMNWDILRMEFGEISSKAIVLSEKLSRDELFELYHLFEKEKRIRHLKARTISPLQYVAKHPLLFCMRLPQAIRRGYISDTIKALRQFIEVFGYEFKKKNSK